MQNIVLIITVLPREPIERWLNEGLDVILEIEVQGGLQVLEKRPDSVGIFILPPSLQELEQRLKNQRNRFR